MPFDGPGFEREVLNDVNEVQAERKAVLFEAESFLESVVESMFDNSEQEDYPEAV